MHEVTAQASRHPLQPNLWARGLAFHVPDPWAFLVKLDEVYPPLQDPARDARYARIMKRYPTAAGDDRVAGRRR